jgi:hypothetical protein
MANVKSNTERWAFIDVIQDWFFPKRRFWGSISLFSFLSLIILQVIFSIASNINPGARQETDFLVIPLLALFVFSIFWRGSIPTFLSLAGSLMTYAGMYYIQAKYFNLQNLPPTIANRLGYGIISESHFHIDQYAQLYFLSGIFFLTLCLVISLKPSFFRARGAKYSPYPVWNSKDSKIISGKSYLKLIPVSSLLNFAEQHIASTYKYILLMINETIYFVSPDDWIPQGSNIIRDKETGSLIGIPKVPDGFNIW